MIACSSVPGQERYTNYIREMRLPSLLALVLCFCAGTHAAESSLNFKEVYDLLRTNLTDVSQTDLDRLAALGLIKQLEPMVQFGADTNSEKKAAAPLKSAVYNDTYAFIRLPAIDAASPSAFQEAYKSLASSNRLRGLVLDLRFCGGTDYNAAAQVADKFLKKEEPLLKWNDTVVRSTAKSDAIELPVAILVNAQTTGAAEALAALLREKEAGLVIGSPTAGRTRVFENFTLSTGQQLRIGKTPVELASGKPIKALDPDIRVAVEPGNERAWYEDPYKNISRVFGQSTSTNDLASVTSTNRVIRRMNEAELVRRHREGAELDGEVRTDSTSGKPVITDPVLARALDFLKGVSVLQQLRSP
jgi:hypothetical protein